MLNRLFITFMLIVLSSTMTKGQQKLYYWFDTPTTLRGQKVWYEGHRERSPMAVKTKGQTGANLLRRAMQP